MVELTNTLQEAIINMFNINEIIVNQDKFQAIMIEKQKISIGNQNIEAVTFAGHPSIQLCDKLNFNIVLNLTLTLILPRMGLFGAFHRWKRQKGKTYVNHVTYLLSSDDISTFLPEMLHREYRYRLYFDT